MKHIVVSIVLFSLSWSTSANSENFKVQDIQITGLQRVALGAALTNVPFSVGDQVSEFVIGQSIKTLFKSGYFSDVKVFRDGDTIIYQVTERPTISEIEFDGNSDIKDEQLQSSLDDSNIRIGEALDKTLITNIETGLTDFYHSVGKYNATVEAKITYLPRNRVRLNFNFEEGDAAKIKQINIVGNKVFTDEELLNKIESKFNLDWWQFTSNDRYQKQALQGDIEIIRDHYLAKGYLKFNIESTQVSVDPNKEAVYITFNVDEDEPYTVTGFEFIGDLLGQEELLTKIVPIQINELYNGEVITYTEEMITRYLSRFGYANAKVQTIPDLNEETKEVALTISVDPGKRVYVKRITFEGNFGTSDEVLRREMRQFEGATLSNDLLEASKSYLQRLKYIETVDFVVNEIPGVDDGVNVVFKIKEQPSGSFQAGVSYGDYTGLAFNAAIQQENFLGTGNQIGISVNTWTAQQTISLNYTDNYFTDDGVSLGGQISFSNYDASKVNLVSYSQKKVVVGPTLSWPVMENNRINVGMYYNNLELSQLQPYDQIKTFSESFLDPNNPDAKFKFENVEASVGWSRSTLNRGVFPSAGSSQYLGLKASIPGSDVQYFKINFDSKFYFPLTQSHKWTFLTRLEMNYGNGYGDLDGNEQTLPFWENMQQRSTDLRGFESNTIGPKGIIRSKAPAAGAPDAFGGTSTVVLGDDFDTIDTTYRATGGNASFFGGLELITPTPFLSDEYSNSVRTSFFVDAGNVWDTEFDLDNYSNLAQSEQDKLIDYSDIGRYRSSAGMSIQWLSPMGPMVFTWSKPIKEYDKDEHEFFSFNIGTTF
ncbi:outer membrane protein assembly factor BamA [uncultured Psychrosphaera sp.]|uniref:outer membrane protein assembly factor BamA n=1 Tax=uncultured Psychrosphaera sp. TaxID=1403522 RepID=UPI0026325C4A|nr:outer membrane protein assembly factor BamA [uncultured Psychrosphaera sp.]